MIGCYVGQSKGATWHLPKGQVGLRIKKKCAPMRSRPNFEFNKKNIYIYIYTHTIYTIYREPVDFEPWTSRNTDNLPQYTITNMLSFGACYK
jgi:hypothetical protein